MNKITILMALLTLLTMNAAEKPQVEKTPESTIVETVTEIPKKAEIKEIKEPETEEIEDVDVIEDVEDVPEVIEYEEEYIEYYEEIVEYIDYYEEEYEEYDEFGNVIPPEYFDENEEYESDYDFEVLTGTAIYRSSMLLEFNGQEYILDDCEESPFIEEIDRNGNVYAIFKDGQSVEITYMDIRGEILIISVDGIEHTHGPLEGIISEMLSIDYNDTDDPNMN